MASLRDTTAKAKGNIALKTWRKRKFEKKLRSFQRPSAWCPPQGTRRLGLQGEQEVG